MVMDGVASSFPAEAGIHRAMGNDARHRHSGLDPESRGVVRFVRIRIIED